MKAVRSAPKTNAKRSGTHSTELKSSKGVRGDDD